MNKPHPPPLSRSDEIETNELLIEALQSCMIYANRNAQGELVFFTPNHGGIEDAVPTEQAIAGLQRDCDYN